MLAEGIQCWGIRVFFASAIARFSLRLDRCNFFLNLRRCQVSNVFSQRAIAFKLYFVEPLVSGGLVGEILALVSVAPNVGGNSALGSCRWRRSAWQRFPLRKTGFYVDECRPVLRVCRIVRDISHREVCAA